MFRLFTNVENVRKTGELSFGTTPLPVAQVVATAGGDSPAYTTTTAVNDNVIDLSDVEAGNLIVTGDGYQAAIASVNNGANTVTVVEWYDPEGKRGAIGGTVIPTDGQSFSIQRVSVVRSIAITADPTNTQTVYVARHGTSTITDYPLLPGESCGIGDDDFVHVPRIYVRSASGTQKIHWILGSPSGAGNYAVTIATVADWAGAFTWTAIADGDATPDVSASLGHYTANTGPTSITDFTGRTSGMLIVQAGDGDTTIVHDATKIALNGGISIPMSQGDVIVFVERGGVWYQTPF